MKVNRKEIGPKEERAKFDASYNQPNTATGTRGGGDVRDNAIAHLCAR